MAARVAVAFLAREAEGPTPIRRFCQSYRRFRASHPHKLYIIAKGSEDPAWLSWLRKTLEGFSYELLHFPEAAGRDIGAYLWALRYMDGDLVSFYNTFAEINGDDWLGKLVSAYHHKNVGLVGTTGSYESILTGDIIFNRLAVLAEEAAFDKELTADWASFNKKLAKLSKSRSLRLIQRIKDRYLRRPSVNDRLLSFRENGVEGHPWEFLIPPFPNPHIRSNGFLCSREELLHFPKMTDPLDKLAGFRFESGYGGLSHRIRARGERLLIVDRAGRSYDVDDWPTSNTFRAPTTDNLLILDNTTTHFYALSDPVRRIFLNLTFGGNLLGVDLKPDLGRIAA